jgi:HlyD family type I secretion membrane fusion protein
MSEDPRRAVVKLVPPPEPAVEDDPKPGPPAPELGAPSKTAKWTLLVVALAVLALIVWAIFAPLNRGVIAPGRIDVDGQRTVVAHIDGGVVETLAVREGTRVNEGDILLVLGSRSNRLTLEILDQRILQMRIEAAALEAEAARGSAVRWPADIARLLAAPDGGGEAGATARVVEQAFESRVALRESQKAVLREQRDRLDARIAGLEEQRRAIAEQSRLIKDEADGLRSLYEQGLAPKTRILALDRAAADLSGRAGSLQSEIAQARIAKGETELQILQVDARAVEQAARTLAETRGQLAEFEDRAAAQRLTIERSVLRSPVAGVVLGRQVTTPGAVVRPGEPVFEIVPSDKLVLRVQIRPTDIERVEAGMKATARFSGLAVQNSPRLPARVTYVSPDALTDRNTGLSYFNATVEVDPKVLAEKLPGVAITPGMPVEVFVDGGARTAWEYLSEPVVRAYTQSFRE